MPALGPDSFEALIESVLLEILAQSPALVRDRATTAGETVRIDLFAGMGDVTLPCPRICVAARDDREDADVRIAGKYMHDASARIIFTAEPGAHADWIVSVVRGIEEACDEQPAAPVAALDAFAHFTILGRGETEVSFDNHKKIVTVPLTLKAMLL